MSWQSHRYQWLYSFTEFNSYVNISPNISSVTTFFGVQIIKCLPRTKVDFSCRMNHDAHVFTSHEVILDSLHIKEVSIRSPEKQWGICRHVKWCARIMHEPWIIPPLAKENVQWVFLWINKSASVRVILSYFNDTWTVHWLPIKTVVMSIRFPTREKKFFMTRQFASTANKIESC